MFLSVQPFVHSFVCQQTCEQDILNRNDPILMQIGTSGLRGKGVKRSIRRSKVKATRGQNGSQKFLLERYIK